MKKIRELLKNKKVFYSFIGTAIFLILGIIAFIIGAYASGWNVFDSLVSPNAIFWYVVILLLVIPCIIYGIIMYRSSKK